MNWKEPLTYLDAAGKRHWRPWVWGFLVCLGVLVIAGVYAGVLTSRRNAEAAAIDATATVQWAEALTPEPTRTPTPPPTPIPCPTDPAQWMLSAVGEKDNLSKIAPACVYDGLAKSVAFQILTGSMGWTSADAMKLLGFSRIPAEYHLKIEALGNTSDKPYTTNVAGAWAVTEGQGWQFTKDMQPALEMALNGCYKPQPGWGTDYPVVCVVMYDQKADGWARMIGGLHDGGWYAPKDPNPDDYQARRWLFFGYSQKDATWVCLGVEMTSTLPLSGFKDPHADMVYFANRHGLPVWNAAWVQGTWGASMKPLPENWDTPASQQDGKAMDELLYQAYKPLFVSATEATP